MTSSWGQRVQEAFDDNDFASAQKFQDIVLSSWTQVTEAVTRTVIFVFILAAVFELLVASTVVRSLTLGPLSVSNTSLLQLFLPPLISYLLYDAYHLVNRYRDHKRIYTALNERFQPKLAGSELPGLVLPKIRGPWQFGTKSFTKYERLGEKFDYNIGSIITIFGYFIIPIAFEVQAYYALIHKYGAQDIRVWVSLACSAFFLIVWLIRTSIDIMQS